MLLEKQITEEWLHGIYKEHETHGNISYVAFWQMVMTWLLALNYWSEAGESPDSIILILCRNCSFPIFNIYHFPNFSSIVECVLNTFIMLLVLYLIFYWNPVITPIMFCPLSVSSSFHFSFPISKMMSLHPQVPTYPTRSFHSIGLQVSQGLGTFSINETKPWSPLLWRYWWTWTS